MIRNTEKVRRAGIITQFVILVNLPMVESQVTVGSSLVITHMKENFKMVECMAKVNSSLEKLERNMRVNLEIIKSQVEGK